MEDDYKKAFQTDSKLVKKYFKNIEKSEQQKMLEKLLSKITIKEEFTIADIGCGGGKLSYHLNNIYPNNQYYLLDYSQEAIDTAKDFNKGKNFHFAVDNIYAMQYPENYFDITNCLVVVSFLEDTRKAIEELIRVTKKGGHIFISALINFDHDVDLLTKVLDHTRDSSKENLYLTYNTYAKKTFEKWIKPNVSSIDFYPFETTKDFIYEGRGIDTYTVNTSKNKIQLAGGMLLNWGFIHIIK